MREHGRLQAEDKLKNHKFINHKQSIQKQLNSVFMHYHEFHNHQTHKSIAYPVTKQTLIHFCHNIVKNLLHQRLN